MLPTDVTVQPAAWKRCLAVLARPIVDVLFNTTSGTEWAATELVEPGVDDCPDGALDDGVGVAVTVAVAVLRSETGRACRPFG